MEYLKWNEKNASGSDMSRIEELYAEGYVFTRINKGIMHQTRSVRIDLSLFELSSENKRILKKTDGLECVATPLPLTDYDWSIGKLAKDFYDTKFGKGIASAQKFKEMICDEEKSNFNTLFKYSSNDKTIGYTISFIGKSILHYSYPFYNLNESSKDMGMGMMIRAIIYAQSLSLKYCYIGSLQRPSDIYKLQFKGLEWFDGNSWQTDIEIAKNILSSTKKEENK